MKKKVSVVIPCYNEEKSVRDMHSRLVSVFSQLPKYDFDIVFVDDYSTDETRSIIRQLAQEDSRVRGVFNARNFGFHRNVFQSLTYALETGADAAFMLFGDLQDPPENLPQFIEQWEVGFKVVVGQRRSSDERHIMKFSRWLYYKVIDWFAETNQISAFTGYGLYDKEFLNILAEIGDIQPFFKAVVAEYGLSTAIVKYDQAKSSRGKSNFNFLKNYDFAMQGITSSAKLLMRLATFIAAAIALICIALTVFVFVRKIADWNAYPVGEASRTIGIFFLGAIQLFFIGILGEYILTINGRVVRKPRVVVGERVNFGPQALHVHEGTVRNDLAHDDEGLRTAAVTEDIGQPASAKTQSVNSETEKELS
ncbi:glycosyltransferase involved in cell wall biosynthesis [Arcanobacterium pluranimalium]|uniref:glycosyltransferase family 2 protein n=1 Tax=Arcanobacterium pluranimalium TaxID=108028 RepID=UPI00195D85E4|nr:glycosyltransferase family 2 protein [Arcanobacterium pluranimalium]MBM7824877.1 glycosyltransferase involved in cell wall biosynthesis [Arcanobacterium pluranimalium]